MLMECVDGTKWIPIFTTVLTILGSIGIWAVTQRASRKAQERARREERYQALLDGLRGFYVDSIDNSLKTEFLRQLNLAWMYCPDEVIELSYDFLEMVRTGVKKTDEEKELAVGKLVLSIRRDMASGKILKKTALLPQDFRHLKAT